MNRPPRPRMMNNMYRRPMPYNSQWRPNNGQPPRFQWNNPRFGAPDARFQNSDEHWCETCDRGFPTAELLQQHNSQHQKCNIDGCQFIAHPKVITKHIQMQHSSGLYKKIANLNNPEDIQKWREERKKKYPTKANIEKKEAENKEKIERGEKMALKRDRRTDKRGPTDQGPRKRNHSFDRRNQNPRMNRRNFKDHTGTTNNNQNNTQPAKKIPRTIPSAPVPAEKNKLKPFAGILSIVMDHEAADTDEPLQCNDDLFEDDEEIVPTPKETTTTQEPIVCGALTSLMCDYGTSDEDAEEKENEVIAKSTEKTNQSQVNDDNKIKAALEDKPDTIENNESDNDAPEEIKIEKTNVEHETSQEAVVKSKEKVLKTTLPVKKPERNDYKVKRKIPSTLLQKLLYKEIRQERNIVLQCIRYIKKNNYFDKPDQ